MDNVTQRPRYPYWFARALDCSIRVANANPVDRYRDQYGDGSDDPDRAGGDGNAIAHQFDPLVPGGDGRGDMRSECGRGDGDACAEMVLGDPFSAD